MEFIYAAVFLLLVLLLSYFTGAFLFSLNGQENTKQLQSFFFRIFTGACTLVFLYALARSGGRTVMLLLIVPALFLWLKTKKKRTVPFSESLKPPVKWLGLAALLAVFVLLVLHYFHESVTIQEDSANYLKISEALRLCGQENTRHFRNVYSSLFHGMEPYHYFEMWLAALFMDLSGGLVSHLECLRSCSYGLVLTLAVLGLLCVCENSFQKLNAWHVLMAFLFLFFIPNLVQLFFNYDKHFNYAVESCPMNRDNFRTYWMFLLPALLFFQRKDFFSGSILLLLLPVISFTTAPAVLGTLGILTVCNRWTKFYAKTEARRLFLLLLVVAVLLLGMLSVFKLRNVESLYSFTPGAILAYFKASWKAVIYFLFIEIVNVLIVFAPYFVVLALLVKKGSLKTMIRQNAFLLVFVVLINLCGIVLFQLTSFMNNTYQFAFTGFCAAALVLFVLFQDLLAAFEKESSRRIAYTAFLLLMLFSAFRLTGLSRTTLFEGRELYSKNYTRYSQPYLDSVKQFVKQSKGPGAYIGDSVYYAKMYYSKRLPDFYFPGSAYFIFAQANDAYQFCLSDTDAIYYGYNGSPRDFVFLRQAVGASLFHRDFVLHKTGSMAALRREALEKYHIRYVILTPGVKAEDEWADLIARSFRDAKTGEQFVVLK